jgi:fructose-bisphosphate aldolase class II
MPTVALREILGRAFAARYGVAAVNVVNDVTLESVLSAAVEESSPIIVQTSVKTLRSMGAPVFYALWRSMTAGLEVPAALHLDHCPDRAVITECLQLGWNSVLFDASALPVAENQRQTIEVVEEARRFGADVEGEIETISGVEDGLGSDETSRRQSLEVTLSFIRETGIDVFAPAIGNAHGMYSSTPELDTERVSDLVALTGVPIALHGGSGLSKEQFADLISRGCAKVNISTALKRSFMQSSLAFLHTAEASGVWEPLALFQFAGSAVRTLVAEHIRLFGSAGMAW